MASFKSPDRDPEVEAAKLHHRFRTVTRQAQWRKNLREAIWWNTLWAKGRAIAEPSPVTTEPEKPANELPIGEPLRRVSRRAVHRDPEKEAERLKHKFRSISRKIEWRYRVKEMLWWLTVCVVASISAFAGVALLLPLLP
jgi:uncharacterized membrane protein